MPRAEEEGTGDGPAPSSGLDEVPKPGQGLALDLPDPLSGTRSFSNKLRQATAGRFQLSTDAFTPYRTAVWDTFGPGIDFGVIVNVYGNPPEGGAQARFSPGEVIGAEKLVCIGQPDHDQICTSHSERQNLTMRMTLRRLTRLTNAHSKKRVNHYAAVALYFAYYNFCRDHETLHDRTGAKCTPVMAAGLTDHV